LAVSASSSVKDTLENLIEQFTDVYCFYRELIQNSLDAGTNRVDVWLEYIPPEKGSKDGVIAIHVDDYGEGMNRDIIDNQLTRLFSSSKENDLTKIGKFGIGFVSVFAIKPDAVNIDTSRDGQDWRVLFNRNKEFERLKRDYPVDGTKITIYKTGSRKFYRNFLKRSRETVKFWCKHSEAEIYFQDEMVNEPFDIDSPIKIHINEDAGEVVAGYSLQNPPPFGYYNQGLTLVEGNQEFFKNIAFKIKSKYLEHTLTRDNIRQDRNYWKAMELLNDVARNRLPKLLFETLEREIKKGDKPGESYDALLPFARIHLEEPDSLPRECLERKFARDTEGNLITVEQMLRIIRQDSILYDHQSNPVTRALAEKGKIVLLMQSSQLHKMLRSIQVNLWHSDKKRLVKASDEYFIPQIIESKKLDKVQKSLIAAVDRINRKMSVRTELMKFAKFDYPGSCIKDRVYVMQKEPGGLSPVSELNKKEKLNTSLFSLFSKTKTLILNVQHPYVKNLLNLARFDLEFASYLFAKLLYLDDGIETETDANLALAAFEGGDK